MLMSVSREQASPHRRRRRVHFDWSVYAGGPTRVWWKLADDARQLNSHSVACKGIDTSCPVDTSFHMGSTDSPRDGPIIGLAGERAVLRHGRLEGWRRIAGGVGVRHGVAELAVRHCDDRLARCCAPGTSLGFLGR